MRLKKHHSKKEFTCANRFPRSAFARRVRQGGDIWCPGGMAQLAAVDFLNKMIRKTAATSANIGRLKADSRRRLLQLPHREKDVLGPEADARPIARHASVGLRPGKGH